MTVRDLRKDPFNLIIVGVAGQGNVLISLMVCNALVNNKYLVTFGQTYPSQQRGGIVINYIRISRKYQCSPIIPSGQADVILGMEPVETLRMLGKFGNPNVCTIVNPRPIYPIDISSTEIGYPDINILIQTIKELSSKTWVIDASSEAEELGDPIYANIILTGALVASRLLPLNRESLKTLLKERFPGQFKANLLALERGFEIFKR